MARLKLMLPVALVVVLGSSNFAVEAHAAERGCQPRGSTTLTATDAVRVYALRGYVYACNTRVGASRRLGLRSGQPKVRGVRIAGRFVGYWLESHDPANEQDVRTVDTRSRRVRVRGTCGPSWDYRCRELVLTRTGAVAWTNFHEKDGATTLRKSDRAGAAELDYNPLGPITDLALAGSRLYWTKAGAAHSANLL
jgi:hypothetical protein